MIRVLVIDDHPVVREGLVAVLSDEPEFRVVGQAASAEEALINLDRIHPDVVVVDLRLPGMTGIEACKAIQRRRPSARVVVLTSFPNNGAVVNAFAAGAKGFVLKESQPNVLREAIRAVGGGHTFADPRIASKLVTLATQGRRAKGPFDLTPQEMRVLEQLPKGLSNREIGDELGIREATVKTHLSNAMHKINARDRVEAAAIALREGLA